MVKFLSRTLILAFFFNVSQASCPEVRLDKTSLKSVPILDQDGSGLCWSYTASLLIDAYRFSHGDKEKLKLTSPIALAVKSSHNKYVKNGDGYVNIAINQARRDGYSCDHYDISEVYKSTDFHNVEFAEFWYPTLIGKGQKVELINNTCGRLIDKFGHQITTLREISLRSIVGGIDQLCASNKIKIDIPSPLFKMANELKGFPDRQPISNFLQERLSKPDPQPIAISYCEDVLRDKSVRSVDSYGEHQGCKNHHLSAVVGSRTSANGKCEFLVRNSYGASCSPYAWPCERGQIWVPEEELSHNILGFTWLD